jgi:hypothetical protein
VRKLLPHLPLAPFPSRLGAAAMGPTTSGSGRGGSEVHRREPYLVLTLLQVIRRLGRHASCAPASHRRCSALSHWRCSEVQTAHLMDPSPVTPRFSPPIRVDPEFSILVAQCMSPYIRQLLLFILKSGCTKSCSCCNFSFVFFP